MSREGIVGEVVRISSAARRIDEKAGRRTRSPAQLILGVRRQPSGPNLDWLRNAHTYERSRAFAI